MFVGGKQAPYLKDEYEVARTMRREGVPIKRIAASLGVSPGTVHRWTTDIELTDAQRRRIDRGEAERWRRVVKQRAESWSERCRQQRREHQELGRRRAREGNSMHQAGCMLYWAEGAKHRNRVAFCNSDRSMTVFFKRFLVEEFELPPERFKLSINVYLGNDLSLKQIETAWLEALTLPRSCARKHTTNHMPTSSSGRRKNKLPYGVCSLVVTRSTDIVQHIYGAIQEYAGFEEPAWLD